MTTQNTEGTASVPAQPGAPASTPVLSDFAGDASVGGLREAVHGYIAKVRSGDAGALPAYLGLVVMLVVFNFASPIFLTKGNLANLPAQGATTALIGMGLVFVLLLGEIDLSAGTGSGVSAATMALALYSSAHGGDLHKALGTGTFWAVAVGLLAALAVAVQSRLWIAVAVVALGFLDMVTGVDSHVLPAIFLAVAVGTAIGLLTGFLVARVGIPSFVVTLALFLAWQGVLLKLIGLGNAVSTGQFSLINDLANKNVPVAWGWVMVIVLLVGYVGFTVTRGIRRRSEGLSAEPMSLVLSRAAVLAVVGLGAMYFLNAERSPNYPTTSIRGMPWVVPVILVLMVFWTLVLNKSSFGRHLYAVGGNTEAARRAGIDVARTKVAAFAICSAMAALGGIVAASKLGDVPADAGGGNTLLYAVGAAVIGGTSLFGGRGRVRDAVLGAVVIAMIPNGLGLLPNLNASYDFMVTGLVLLLAASVDALSRRRARSSVR